MESKKELRRQLIAAEDRHMEYITKARASGGSSAKFTLEGLGYEYTPDPAYSNWGYWRLTPKARAAAEKRELERAASLDAFVADARAQQAAETRRETLEAVIEALALEEYQAQPSNAFFWSDPTPDTEAFWADIQVTLKDRAEDAELDAIEAARKRIESITAKLPETEEAA